MKLTGLKKTSSSQPGRERQGKVSLHRLLAADKREVVLPKPIEFKVMSAKGEQMSS